MCQQLRGGGLKGQVWNRQSQVKRHPYSGNLFIYQARESSLVPAGFLTAQFLQKLYIYEAFVYTFPFLLITTKAS